MKDFIHYSEQESGEVRIICHDGIWRPTGKDGRGIHGGIGGIEMVVLWLCSWSMAVRSIGSSSGPETNLAPPEIPKAETSLVQEPPLCSSIPGVPLIGLRANQNAT